MQSAVDSLVPPAVVEMPNGPPLAGQSGWLFHLDAKNVQILQILPLKPAEPGEEAPPLLDDSPQAPSGAGFGFRLRLYETEGRQRPVQLRCFRTPSFACQRDFRGQRIATLRIVDDAVYLEPTPYEILEVELRFGDTPGAVNA